MSRNTKKDMFRSYPDIVTVEQLCQMIGGTKPICMKTAYKILKEGKIECFRIGTQYRIPKVNIIRYIEERGQTNV